MRNIRMAVWGGFALLSLLFVAAEPAVFQASGFVAVRNVAIQYSGAVAIVCMSVAMILATRPRLVEGWFGGLDRMYRLHKWLGIGAVGAGLVHWALAQAPGWAVSLGLMTRGRRVPHPLPDDPMQRLLAVLHHPAELLGEYVFYAFVVLAALALLKRFPYRAFFRSHRLMAVAYLGLVAHAVVLVEPHLWLSPLGAALAVLMGAASWAAGLALLGLIGATRRVRGTVSALHVYPQANCVEVTLALPPGAWRGHKAGQFAFVTFSAEEGAHPYTIASAWEARRSKLTFVIKSLGDHTRELSQRLKVGQTATVEGPYGRFTFEDAQPQQIWVGAGIGITPFLARLEQLAVDPAAVAQTIDLFHSTAEGDEAVLARLRTLARAAGVRLHVLVGGRDGRLTGERIRAQVPAWTEASTWFCGPAAFGQALRHDFGTVGMPVDERFHQELFAMR